MTKSKKSIKTKSPAATSYNAMLSDVAGLLEEARRNSVRSVNAIMTATYWEIGRRIVEYEQGGRGKAVYGEKVIVRLSNDLTERFGRGFSKRNVEQMRLFYLNWPIAQIPSAQSGICRTASGIDLLALAARFPLPWSHYVRLMSVKSQEARAFYEAETLRSGWSGPQLDRQISTLFYERTALSRNKAVILKKGEKPHPEDVVTPEGEIRDPLVLEFLGLKDEYSESQLEDALINHLEHFLLELGSDFAFIGRQRRLRIGDSWYRIDLLFYHRCLRCLVVIDLKLDKFTHADAGQMHMYLNYAQEHWTHQDENPPVGLILCAEKDRVLARYALEGLPNKVLAAEYKMVLPNEKSLVAEIDKTRKALEARRKGGDDGR